MEGSGASRPASFYSQASTSSCCPVDEGKREIRNLMDSFVADLQRTVRDTLLDDPAAVHASQTPAAPPARSGSMFDADTRMTQPVPGAYAVESTSGAAPATEEYEHKGIYCDSCGKKIFGVRHKCLDCYNFDVCNPCMTTKDIQSTHADMPHTFEAVHPPQSKSNGSQAPVATDATPPQCLCSVLPRPLGCYICNPRGMKNERPVRPSSYKCDSCQAAITSTRHKCMVCPDFDLCDTCYAAGFPISDHSPVHRFMHIEDPIRVITAPAVRHEPVPPLCAGCSHDGPRYKCDSCGAVDLCLSCMGEVERATVEHAAFHVEQGWDHPVRFVPYSKESKVPAQAPAVPARPTRAIHCANCDACDETIIGTRHKCVICHDFDLCDSCFTARVEPLEHKADHEMLHLDRPMRIVTHVVGPDGVDVSESRPVSTSSTTSAVPSVVHHAWCDGCSERIRGVRHKCLDCNDFDFCDSCFGREHDAGHQFYALVEPGEVVMRDVSQAPIPLRARGRANRMPTPPPAISATPAFPAMPTLPAMPSLPAPPAPLRAPTHYPFRPARPHRPVQPAQHSAACDMCSSRIHGIRYKCTSCPDYDVCESCFRISEEVHPGHSFAKVHKHGDIIVRKSKQTTFRHHARCDVCQNQIMGIRYKCMHPACPDFDICARCEAMPIPVHPDTHALIKLRSHVDHYDGLKTVLAFASRSQLQQSETLRVPAPAIRIPSPRVAIPSPRNQSLGLSTEPITAMDVFHTASPSPVVPLSTLGCTIVPHTTIVASLPHTPSPEVAVSSPQIVNTPVSQSSIPSPPPIPAALLPLAYGSEKLTDSWTAASSSAKLDEHMMHHSDMYKPSYEALSVATASSVVNEPIQPIFQAESNAEMRAARTHELETKKARLAEWKAARELRTENSQLLFERIPNMQAVTDAMDVSFPTSAASSSSSVATPASHAVTVDEERDPEAPQMTLMTHARPVSFPNVPAHEPVAAARPEVVEISDCSYPSSVASPLLVAVPSPIDTPERIATPTPESVASPRPAQDGLPTLISVYPSMGFPAPFPASSVADTSRSPSPVPSQVSVISTSSIDASVLNAEFIEDKSIVDGQVVSGGAEFAKCWRMRNDGPVAWPQGTTISFVAGHSMLIQPDMVHWNVSGDFTPGSEIDVEVEMKAPEEPGRYVSFWRLKTPEGQAFGARIWCDIVVAEMERAGSAGSSELSASSIVIPTHAPSMSAASVSPTMHSVSTTQAPSVVDTADIESIGSLDSDDSAWDEVHRPTQGARSEGDGFEVVYDSD